MKFTRNQQPRLAIAQQTAAVQRQRVAAGRRAHLKTCRAGCRRSSRCVQRQQGGGGRRGNQRGCGRVGVGGESSQQWKARGRADEQRGIFYELTRECEFFIMVARTLAKRTRAAAEWRFVFSQVEFGQLYCGDDANAITAERGGTGFNARAQSRKVRSELISRLVGLRCRAALTGCAEGAS
jgi:hypothetical protein